MTSGIYAIRDGKRSYIGSSVNISKRWSSHRSELRKGKHHSTYLQNAWDKYGAESFEFVILEECAVDVLIEREQHYFDLHPDKYNCAPVVGSCLGLTPSPETRAKIGAAHVGNQHAAGYRHSPETRARISAAKMGHEVSAETREKLRIAAMARVERERRARIQKSYLPPRRPSNRHRKQAKNMGKFAESAMQHDTAKRGDGMCVAGRWIAENFDEADLAELVRLLLVHKWNLIVSLSENNLKEASLGRHVHGTCTCIGDVPGKGCCPCEQTKESA